MVSVEKIGNKYYIFYNQRKIEQPFLRVYQISCLRTLYLAKDKKLICLKSLKIEDSIEEINIEPQKLFRLREAGPILDSEALIAFAEKKVFIFSNQAYIELKTKNLNFQEFESQLGVLPEHSFLRAKRKNKYIIFSSLLEPLVESRYKPIQVNQFENLYSYAKKNNIVISTFSGSKLAKIPKSSILLHFSKKVIVYLDKKDHFLKVFKPSIFKKIKEFVPHSSENSPDENGYWILKNKRGLYAVYKNTKRKSDYYKSAKRIIKYNLIDKGFELKRSYFKQREYFLLEKEGSFDIFDGERILFSLPEKILDRAHSFDEREIFATKNNIYAGNGKLIFSNVKDIKIHKLASSSFESVSVLASFIENDRRKIYDHFKKKIIFTAPKETQISIYSELFSDKYFIIVDDSLNRKARLFYSRYPTVDLSRLDLDLVSRFQESLEKAEKYAKKAFLLRIKRKF